MVTATVVPEVFPPFDYAAWQKTQSEIAAKAPPPEPAAEPAPAEAPAPAAPGAAEEAKGGKPEVDRRRPAPMTPGGQAPMDSAGNLIGAPVGSRKAGK